MIFILHSSGKKKKDYENILMFDSDVDDNESKSEDEFEGKVKHVRWAPSHE